MTLLISHIFGTQLEEHISLLSYEGSGGHHASGILRFPKIEDKKFELVIQDVAGVKERVFKW